jgi:hypothetical protein
MHVGEHVAFVMQSRAFDVGAEEPLHTNSIVTTISEAVVTHCPWCGTDLKKFYSKRLDSLLRDELAMGALDA